MLFLQAGWASAGRRRASGWADIGGSGPRPCPGPCWHHLHSGRPSSAARNLITSLHLHGYCALLPVPTCERERAFVGSLSKEGIGA